MEVFDQLAQFVCNRYPLNSKARKLGPTNTLNDVDVPTKHGAPAVKIKIDTPFQKTVRFCPLTRSMWILWSFHFLLAWWPIEPIQTLKIFSPSFIKRSG